MEKSYPSKLCQFRETQLELSESYLTFPAFYLMENLIPLYSDLTCVSWDNELFFLLIYTCSNNHCDNVVFQILYKLFDKNYHSSPHCIFELYCPTDNSLEPYFFFREQVSRTSRETHSLIHDSCSISLVKCKIYLILF